MLSRSSTSRLSSSTVFEAKNEVGGICLGSPTMTAFSPRASTPTALHVGSWEASSKTTTSKGLRLVLRYCAAEIGLISIQGQRRGRRLGRSSNSLRILVPRPPLRIIRCRMPSSELFAAEEVKSGTFAARRQYISCLQSSVSSPSIRLNCATFSLNTEPEKVLRTGVSSMTIPISDCSIDLR